MQPHVASLQNQVVGISTWYKIADSSNIGCDAAATFDFKVFTELMNSYRNKYNISIKETFCHKYKRQPLYNVITSLQQLFIKYFLPRLEIK